MDDSKFRWMMVAIAVGTALLCLWPLVSCEPYAPPPYQSPEQAYVTIMEEIRILTLIVLVTWFLVGGRQ